MGVSILMIWRVNNDDVTWNDKNKGPHEILLECKYDNVDIVKFHNLDFAKLVYDLGFENIKKYIKKAKTEYESKLKTTNLQINLLNISKMIPFSSALNIIRC